VSKLDPGAGALPAADLQNDLVGGRGAFAAA
jgi:hypothetical protein